MFSLIKFRDDFYPNIYGFGFIKTRGEQDRKGSRMESNETAASSPIIA